MTWSELCRDWIGPRDTWFPTLPFEEDSTIDDRSLQVSWSREAEGTRGEDGEINQMVLVGILDHYGHESHVANTGLEAVLWLRKSPSIFA